jgi:alpha-tubulin suppressor-like RCC1 family protein
VVFAVAGPHHSFAITTDGVLWAWGDNYWGQIGDGTTESRLLPVSVMDDVIYAAMPSGVPCSHIGYVGARSYAIRSDGTLWAWGHNDGSMEWDFALGEGTQENRYSPIQIMENVVSVAPTRSGGFAITDDGVLWGWHGLKYLRNEGDNGFVRIEAQRYPMPIMENIASIFSGFAITSNGELWLLELEPVWIMDDVVYVSGTDRSAFAITTDGTLWAWGQNRLPTHWRVGSVLGDGTTVDRDEPVRIMENIASVTTIGNTTYAISNDGTLWGWGNSGGAWDTVILLGDGALFSWNNVQEHMWEYVYENGFPSGKRWLLDDDGGTGLRLSPVKILENVVYVAASYYMFDHGRINSFRTFALTECGSVWAWGENDVFDRGWSLLGDGTSERRLYPVRIISGE